MTTPRVSPGLLAAGLAALLLAACASDPKSIPAASGQAGSAPLAASPAAQAVARLAKNLTGAQVRELLGAPASTRPIGSGELKSEVWSYPFTASPEVRMVVVGSQDLPAMNPLTGVMTTRSEPVYQNQTINVTDTLHVLVVEDRVIEWRVVREESKKFQ